MNFPVKDKKSLVDRILSHKEELIVLGVKRIGIFGSFVRNEATHSSDVDFFIEFFPEKKTFKNYMRIADFLEELSGRNVEIITPQSLSKYIGPYILKEMEYVPLSA